MGSWDRKADIYRTPSCRWRGCCRVIHPLLLSTRSSGTRKGDVSRGDAGAGMQLRAFRFRRLRASRPPCGCSVPSHQLRTDAGVEGVVPWLWLCAPPSE